MKRIYRAFRTGCVDGWKQPFDLTSGMTYERRILNEAYDWGANAGQLAGRLFKRQ